MSIRKGHEYISIFADLIAKRVIFATEGKDKETWTRFIETLEKHNGHRHSITQVSMDMSLAYEAGVKEYCRNGQVVFDKFHVLANVGKAVDRVRAAELRYGGHEVREALHKSRWLWRKNPENLDEQEHKHLGKIQKKNLCTAKAYQMRLVLQDIYRSPTATIARQRLRTWCRWIRWVARFHPSRLFASMVMAAEMVEDHMAGILAHWKSGITNAFMEGLNSVFSAVKRKARGYRSSVYLITMLYLLAAKLRLPHR